MGRMFDHMFADLSENAAKPLPLIDTPKASPEARAAMEKAMEATQFDPKAVIRGHDPRKLSSRARATQEGESR